MRSIEDTVRDTMRHTVRNPPAMEDSLGRALGGVRRIRRRRAMIAAATVAVAVLAAVGGVTALRGGTAHGPVDPATHQPVPPTPTASTPDVAGVSVLVGEREIVTADGRTLPLTGLTGAAHPYEIVDGYLLDADGTKTNSRSLWLVSPDGSRHRLVDNAEADIAVSPDGGRFAWRADDQLKVGHLVAGGTVVIDNTTPAPVRGAPLALTENAVLLGYSQTGGGLDTFDVWLPANGAYAPSWDRTRHVLGVYPRASGVGSFLGLVQRAPGSKDRCLAALNPADHLRAGLPTCGLGLDTLTDGSMSPHDQLLAVGLPGSQIVVVALHGASTTPRVVATLAATGPGVWTGETTLVAVDSGGTGFVRFHIGQDQGEAVRVPGLTASGPFELIPRSRRPVS